MAKEQHIVECWKCRKDFDLLAAKWCKHKEPTKICPHCGECVCEHPEIKNPKRWRKAPRWMKEKYGIYELFNPK